NAVALVGADGVQRRQLDLVYQCGKALVLHVHRIGTAAAQLSGQLLQCAGVGIGQHAAAQLFAQLSETVGRNHRLLAHAPVDQRHRLAVAAAGEADVGATAVVGATAQAAVVDAAIGTGLRAALVAGRIAILALLPLAALALLTLLAA